MKRRKIPPSPNHESRTTKHESQNPISAYPPARLNLLRAASALYCALIFIESSYPSPDFSNSLLDLIPALDKAAHFLIFGGLGACFFYWLRGEAWGWARRSPSAAAAALAAVYGMTDEIHQLFTPGRDSSIADFAADVAGIAIFIMIVRRTVRRELAA